jgi:sec-independent protein translocase protein TatA
MQGKRFGGGFRKMGMPGPLELSIIAVIVVMVFGVGKLSGIGSAIGTSIREFKSAVKPDDDTQAER